MSAPPDDEFGLGGDFERQFRVHQSAQRRRGEVPGEGPQLWFSNAPWVEAEIPRRPWAVPHFLLRRVVTVVGGVGSAGKSLLGIAWGASAALGMDFGRFSPPQPLRVLIYNAEDDCEEQRRRLSAVLRQFDRFPRDLGDRLGLAGPETIATLVRRDPSTGEIQPTEGMDDLERLIRQHRPDIVLLDPLRNLHTAEENDNMQVQEVMTRFAVVARRHNVALCLVHHFRKGGQAGDADAFAGAAAIIGSSRMALSLTPMTEKEAEESGIAEDRRLSYARLQGAKSNYTRKGVQDWYEIQSILLDNEEEVPALVPWERPKLAGGLVDADALAGLELVLEAGVGGLPYSVRVSTTEGRSWRLACERAGFVTAKQRDAAWRELERRGWGLRPFLDFGRHPRQGIRSPAGRPKANWLDNHTASEGGK